MIIRLPAPKDKKGRPYDIWEMVHVWRCYECAETWSMSEEDDKPQFCPYCGKGRHK
jgi:hypothetical protein